MKRSDIENLEKCLGKIEGFHTEMGALSKKSPDGPLNTFKLAFINRALADVNNLLGKEYRPFEDFDLFSEDALPTNSDVVLILAQYREALELYRAAHIRQIYGGGWVYQVEDPLLDKEGKTILIRTRPPVSLGKK